MLAFRTTDDWAWSLTITDPNTAADTYVNTATDSLSAATALGTWLNQVGRPWYATGLVFFVTWTRSAVGGSVVSIVATAEWEADGGASLTLGIDADTYNAPPFTATGLIPAVGVWEPSVPVSVRGYARSLGDGDGDGTGATRPGSPGRGGYAPIVEAVASPTEAAYLTALLSTAVSPRVALIQQDHTGLTRTLSIGEIQRTREGNAYRLSFAAGGVPV